MRFALAIAATLCLVSLPALAEPTEAEKDAARILFTEGKELRDAGKIAASLERFQRAYELAATPITALELARTHSMLGHLVEARRLAQSVDALEKKPGESPKSLAARDDAKQLGKELDAKIPTIVIRAEGSATLDGKPVQTGVAFALDPGKHVVIVGSKTESFTVSEGEHDRVIAIAAPAKVEPKPKPIPETPPPPAKTNTLVWVGAVTGGVGLLVGAGAGALALSSASNVKDGCPGNICPPSRHDDLDATRTWATVSTIGFAVGAVGATLFVIGLSSSPSTKKDAVTATIVPYASAAGGGFGLSGSF